MTALPNLSGQTLGRYLIRTVESAGSSGAVYRATDLRSNGHSAVILSVFEAAGNGNAADLFVEAGKRLSRLRHPHWIPVLEHGESGNLRYVAIAHIEGRSLSRLMLDPALRQREQLALIADAVCRQIGSALAYLHEHGVLHGAVDMHTIIQAADGRFLLSGAGFGYDFAARDDADARFLIGAFDRAAQDASGAAVADGGGDLFALGAVLYELVCGMPLSVFVNAGYQAPPIPGGVLPRNLHDVIHTLIEPHPNDRYATAREVIAALDGAALQHRRVDAPPAAPPQRPNTPPPAAPPIRSPKPGKPPGTMRRLLGPALAGALIACVGGVYAASRVGANNVPILDNGSSGVRSGVTDAPAPKKLSVQAQITTRASVSNPAEARVSRPTMAPAQTRQPLALPATTPALPESAASATSTRAASASATPKLASTAFATPAPTRAGSNAVPPATLAIDLSAVAIQTPVQRATAAPQPTRTPTVVRTTTLTPTLAPTTAPPTQPPAAATEVPPTATAPPIDGDINLPQPIEPP